MRDSVIEPLRNWLIVSTTMSAEGLYRRNPARDAEAFAVALVRSWVGDRATVEDTSPGHGPDFHILYRDGRSAWGEVAWYEDHQMREMWSNAFRHDKHQQIDLPIGVGHWIVELVKGASIKRLYEELPVFLSSLAARGVGRLSITGPWPRGEPADTARSLGVDYVDLIDKTPDVAVFFMPPGGGTVPTDPDVVATWVSGVLADPDYQDTTNKLLALDADERHVFLVAGSRTDFGVDERLRRLALAVPRRAPVVPAGITHVWVVSQFGDGPAGLWTAETGWSTVDLAEESGPGDQPD